MLRRVNTLLGEIWSGACMGKQLLRFELGGGSNLDDDILFSLISENSGGCSETATEGCMYTTAQAVWCVKAFHEQFYGDALAGENSE